METRLVDLGELPEKALIWDVGAYQGDWARDIRERYPKADLRLFEPVRSNWERLAREGFTVHTHGLDNNHRVVQITLAGDRSSIYEMGYEGSGHETIELRSILEVLGKQTLDVMNLNVEGSEYPILEMLLEYKHMWQIGILLVQFHTFIPNFGERYLAIKKGLEQTHKLAWRTPFVWERWDPTTTP